ncbi:MAG: hypothetical protein VB092_09560 [Oscillospiraceae bacterium]|nr:hypothetical protein [Oscillospiraceae bacterium]
MKNHRVKMIAPIIVTVIFVLYYLGFAAICITIPEIPPTVKVIFGIVPLVLAGAMIYVLIKRIKEIRSGEEDDLGQY